MKSASSKSLASAWKVLPSAGYHSLYMYAFTGTFVAGNTAGRKTSMMAAFAEAMQQRPESSSNTDFRCPPDTDNIDANIFADASDSSGWAPPEGSCSQGASQLRPDRFKHKLSNSISVNRHSIFEVLRELALENAEFFENAGWFFQTYQNRFADTCRQLHELVSSTEKYVRRLQTEAPRFDYDALTPGNGYRSIVCVTDTCVLQLVRLLRHVRNTRQSLVFRSQHHCKELEAYLSALKFLTNSMTGIAGLLDKSTETEELFPLNNDWLASQQISLMRELEHLDNSSFYGRAMGFQFPPSIGRVFHFIGIVLATYSVRWEKGTSWASLFDSGKLVLSPERRARRIIKVTREADISFCKGFWNMSEEGLYYHLPQLLTRSTLLAHNEVMQLPVDAPQQLTDTDGNTVIIPIPSAHTGVRPVNVRLLASTVRQGMTPSAKEARSSCLLFHCHGGGFVATSSKSHETYLRHWARSLDCPVFSVDYSLAPDDPYPRPTEEVIFAYAWAINNAHKLGWTGERIVCVGDSAGGNLLTSLMTRMVRLRISRMPDGLVLVYTPTIFQYLPSPSRLLHMMDPLLHMGIVMRCIMAYTGQLRNVDPGALANNAAANSLDTLDVDEAAWRAKHNKAHRRASLGPSGHKSLQEYCSELMSAQKSSHVSTLLSLDLNASEPLSESAEDNEVFHTPEEHRTPAHKPVSVSSSTQSNTQFHFADEADELAQYKDLAANVTADSGCPDMSPAAARDRPSDSEESNGPLMTVEIHNDANRIWLHGAISGDEEFVEYLSQHPLTKPSLQRTHATPEPLSPTQSPFASFDDLSALTQSPSVSSEQQPPQQQAVSASKSLHAIPSKRALDRTTCVDSGGEPSSPTSDEKLIMMKRNRSLSQSVSNTVALATAHMYDNLSGLMEAAVPEPQDEHKRPLARADPFSQSSAALSTAAAAAVPDSPGVDASTADDNDPYEMMFKKLLNEPASREPELSPMYASDEMLRAWPPTYFVAGHLDPLLDDTVAFARRMRRVGGRVQGVDLLDSLPHGFLNFTLLSPECRTGAKVVLNRIQQAFNGASTPSTPPGGSTKRPVKRTV